MRILYFYQYFTTPKGAWSTRAYEFARRWVEAGDHVTVITPVYDKSDIQPDRFITRRNIDGIDVRVVNIVISNQQSLLRQAWTFLQYAAVSCWYALTLPSDVVLSSSGPITVALPGLAARYLKGKAYVLEVRDLWPEGAIQLGLIQNRLLIWFLREFERFCYRSSRFTVALSDGARSWIAERYGIQHLQVVTNACDNELANAQQKASFNPPEWANGRPLVIYAGAMGQTHACTQLLDIAAHLEQEFDSPVELVAIGTGADYHRLVDGVRTRGLRHFHLLGQRSREEVFAWLNRALCVLSIVNPNPFLDMSSPNKLFDAFAAGRPVIQDTQGWIKELLQREQCGVTVPRGDSRAMAQAIAFLACNQTQCELLAANALRVAREQFDRGLLAGRMRRILQEAARP
jgi:glycosyltransferase involved in cell wall biosynthesis